MKILLFVIPLTSCTISGGFGVHDHAFDSEYREDNLTGWVQGDHYFNENISLYFRHESMPLIREENNPTGGGYGFNSLGIAGKLELGK